LMGAGMSLSQQFGIDLAALLPTTSPVRVFATRCQALTAGLWL